ncbi:MAG: hypothetical protein AB1791_10950 [Chloroflexota bacterium]
MPPDTQSPNPPIPAAKEWLLVTAVSLAAVLLTLLPYVLGYTLARPGTVFSGLIMNPEDSQSYFAKMLEGYDGGWLYTIPFTAEPHTPAFVGGFYLTLGHLARAAHLSLEAAWQLARLSCGFFLYLTLFGFVKTWLPGRRHYWTAFCLAAFGSGLGWLLFLVGRPYWLGEFPVDFKMPEAHPFFTVLTFPHASFSTALILLSMWLMGKALGSRRPPTADGRPTTANDFPATSGRGSWLYASAAGLVNLLLVITYPYLIYLIVLTAGLFWLVRIAQLVGGRRPAAVIFHDSFLIGLSLLVPAPLVIYYAFTTQNNPIFRAWATQSVTPSPPWPHYLVAYGLLLLLALLPIMRNAYSVIRNRRYSTHDVLRITHYGLRDTTLLWLWLLAATLLLFAPVNAQRRFVQGVQVPLAVLATIGLLDVALPWLERRRWFRRLAERPGYSAAGLQRLLLVAFLAFMSLSNVYVLVSVSVTAALQQPDPLFRRQAEVEAVAWLRENTPRTAVVLGDYQTGNLVAARAGNRVVIGHWTETADFATKVTQVARFYSDTAGDAWRQEWLARYGVAYVWYGPRERSLGAFNPSRATYLQPVYEAADFSIFAVVQENRE